jgi:DNA-cytosine methyltransferase
VRDLHLFAGRGGGILGSIILGHTCVAAVDINPHARAVLAARQRDGLLPAFPIYGNVRPVECLGALHYDFDPADWIGRVDVLCGGFPCQPYSVAGKQLGAEDERDGWPDVARILGVIRPPFGFFENVPGLLAGPRFGDILADLAALGYDVHWHVFGADDVGAPHRRDRLWMLAVRRPVPDPGGPGLPQRDRNAGPPGSCAVSAGTAGGGLSPTWVEWLMGWPINWTAVDGGPSSADFRAWLTMHRAALTAWKGSATDKCPSLQPSPGTTSEGPRP